MSSIVRVAPPKPLVLAELNVESVSRDLQVSTERETRLTLTIATHVFAPSHLNHESVRRSPQYRNAEEMINRHVYGPTIDALGEVIHLIYQHDEQGAIERIEAILRELNL